MVGGLRAAVARGALVAVLRDLKKNGGQSLGIWVLGRLGVWDPQMSGEFLGRLVLGSMEAPRRSQQGITLRVADERKTDNSAHIEILA